MWDERADPLEGGAKNGEAMMDAFLGNPPFMGGGQLSGRFGNPYRDWLLTEHSGSHGNSDLSAHFFRRAANLLGHHGTIGLIATNTIAQGDTRETGLRWLVAHGWSVYGAVTNLPWPGDAAVTVSVVHLAYGAPPAHTSPMCEGQPCAVINSQLAPRPERSEAQKLQANAGMSYLGAKIYGQGFLLTPDEREALLSRDRRNGQRIFPYLGGKEVNTSPTQDFDRYVISFGDMSLEQAEAWPDLLAIVREKVKPERDKNKREVRRKYWWRFGETTPALYAALAPLSRCLVTSQVSKHLCFAFQPTDRIFSHALYAFPLESHTAFAVLQSRVHEPWARLLSSSMKTDLRYAASDCFDTFPFPQADPRAVLPALEDIGGALYEQRARFMRETQQGLTKTYNALKDPTCQDKPVQRLRELHEALDEAVLAAYGWDDLQVPAFCPRGDAQRRALERFQSEVIDRLFVLNAERAEAEAALGMGKGLRKLPKAAVANENALKRPRKKTSADEAANASGPKLRKAGRADGRRRDRKAATGREG